MKVPSFVIIRGDLRGSLGHYDITNGNFVVLYFAVQIKLELVFVNFCGTFPIFPLREWDIDGKSLTRVL